MKKYDLNTFIKKYKNKYPNSKYTFDNSIYVNTKVKMKVTCPIHGDFEIRPNDLMNGSGCQSCGGTKKMTEKEFIEKANHVHNNFFTYEHCKFTTVSDNVIVTCPIHGDFKVKASNHLNGCNCKKCQNEHISHTITKTKKINASTKKLNTNSFIEKAKSLNLESDYDFSETIYDKNNKKLKIICKKHGCFYITPNHFLSGRGCPECARNKKKTTDTFIKELKEKQPYSDYDFSMVEYVNVHKPIKLKCNKCGCVFYNSPSNLLKGNKCPGCNISSMESEIKYALEKENIYFVYQKKFEWLINKRLMSLDFYIPEKNIAIECQGQQHFIENIFGKKQLKEVAYRDKLKKELCSKNNIKMVYYANYHMDFPYFVYENIEELISYIKNS